MSTQEKALPDNLDALAQRDDFKKVNSDETIKTLKTKLDDADVAYTSTDDKAELVWRWMEYQGIDFIAEENNTEAVNTNTEPSDVEVQNADIESEDEGELKQTDEQSSTTVAGNVDAKNEGY